MSTQGNISQPSPERNAASWKTRRATRNGRQGLMQRSKRPEPATHGECAELPLFDESLRAEFTRRSLP